MCEQTPVRLLQILLICMTASAHGAASAASLDEAKLRVLSCDFPRASQPSAAEHGTAISWLNESAVALPNDAGQHLAGPIRLGRACLKNVTVTAAFGAVITQGEICNDRLEDFTGALAAAGTALDKAVGAKVAGAVLKSASGERTYRVTNSLIDMRTGKQVPTSTPYAFMCSAAMGGPQ